MKLLTLLLLTTLAFSQPLKQYRYGCEGIELIGHFKDSTLIYSHRMAKCEIKREVADSIVSLYLHRRIKSQMISLDLPKVNVKGKLVITKKKTLVNIMFFYQQVKWKDSITEIPKTNRTNY